VTDKVIAKLGIVAEVEDYLKKGGTEVKVFDEVKPEPSIDTVKKRVVGNRDFDPDVIIGLRGGPAIEASKDFRIFFEHAQLTFGEAQYLNSPPKVMVPPSKKTITITILTTSGIDSEGSQSAVVTVHELSAKTRIYSPEICASIAILDSDLADSMPSQLVAHTGLDALTHVSKNAATNLRKSRIEEPESLLMACYLGGKQYDFHYPSNKSNFTYRSRSKLRHSFLQATGISFQVTACEILDLLMR